MKKYLECALCVGTHGVRGMIKLKSLADSPEALAAVGKLYTQNRDGTFREWEVTNNFLHKGTVVAALSGIDDLDAAIRLKGTVFLADRDSFDLGEGDFFIADVIGLPVMRVETGETVGTLSDVLTDRVQHLYVVNGKTGEFMIPGVPEFIKKVVPEGDGAGVYVHLIDGMIEETGNGVKNEN